jgi:hypothetical protein
MAWLARGVWLALRLAAAAAFGSDERFERAVADIDAYHEAAG